MQIGLCACNSALYKLLACSGTLRVCVPQHGHAAAGPYTHARLALVVRGHAAHTLCYMIAAVGAAAHGTPLTPFVCTIQASHMRHLMRHLAAVSVWLPATAAASYAGPAGWDLTACAGLLLSNGCHVWGVCKGGCGAEPCVRQKPNSRLCSGPRTVQGRGTSSACVCVLSVVVVELPHVWCCLTACTLHVLQWTCSASMAAHAVAVHDS